jgi:acetyl esterase/lipase
MRDRPFRFSRDRATMAGMTALELDRPAPARLQRIAELRLRSSRGPLAARVAWPATAEPAPPLLVFFPDPERDASSLCRALCGLAGVVVLSAAPRSGPDEPESTAFDDAAAVLGWAADHAQELDADPGRLIVGGERAGAALAAAVTLHARDEWWPAIARQLLIHPALDAWRASVRYASSLRTAPLCGSAPATVVWSSAAGDGGRLLGGRLAEAGVEVEELRHEGVPGPALHERVARSLRQV